MNKINPENTRIGWIGTGVMGKSMCGHLLRAGYPVTLYTRTAAKADKLVEQGATWAKSPREVAENADVIFSIVGYPSDVEEVLMGNQGALKGCSTGKILVDMTTSTPSLAKRISSSAEQLGAYSIDAPVSGGDIGAKNGTLSIMIGGDQKTVHTLAPLWDLMGSTWIYQGEAGAGQHTKMVNQTLVAANMVGVCEALLYGYQAGLDLEKVLQSVASGAAGSWSLSNLAPRIMNGNFDPGFFVEHFIKDMGIALDESHRMDLSLPGLELCRQLYQELADLGHSRKGTHALILALAKMSNLEWNVTSSS